MLVPLPTVTVPVALNATMPVKNPAAPVGVVVNASQAEAVKEPEPERVTLVY